MSIFKDYAIFLFFLTSTGYANSWSNMYLGTSVGNLSRNYESQQILLAQGSSLLSDTYNLSIDRGFVYQPQESWLKHFRFRVDGYSTIEIGQHGSNLTIEKAEIAPNQSVILGLGGLYNTEEKFGFIQANLGTTRKSGNTQISLLVNMPTQKNHLFDSNLSQNLYTIANGARGADLSSNQKKQVAQTILNQAVTDSTEIDNIYNAVLAVQANAKENSDADYQPVFSTYSDKTASLYHNDLVAANKAGQYDLIAQYGVHIKVAQNHLWQSKTLNSAIFATASRYQEQTMFETGFDIIDLTGSRKSITPMIQTVLQNKQWRLRGAISIRWYLDKAVQQVVFPHEFNTSKQQINMTAKRFQPTNLNA